MVSIKRSSGNISNTYLVQYFSVYVLLQKFMVPHYIYSPVVAHTVTAQRFYIWGNIQKIIPCNELNCRSLSSTWPPSNKTATATRCWGKVPMSGDQIFKRKNHDIILFLWQLQWWSSHWAGRNNKQLKLAPTRFEKRHLPAKHYPGGTFVETESPTISRPEISRCWWTKGRHSPAVKSHLGGCFSQYFSLFLLVIYLCGDFCICSQ